MFCFDPSYLDPFLFSPGLSSLRSTMPQASEHRMSRAREQAIITSQPKSSTKLPTGHHRGTPAAVSNGLSVTPKLRPLPPRPGPLDDRGKKLELDRGRASKRGDALRSTASRRGPVKGDHALRVPSCSQGGTIPGSTSFTLAPGALLGGPDSECQRSNLMRSKSISIGDLSQAGSRGEEQLSAVLNRLALRDCSPSCSHKLGLGSLAMKRSSSLRRVNVSTGLDGRASATLLSVRTEGCLRTRATDPQATEYAHSQDNPRSTSPPSRSKASAPSRLDEKATTVRDCQR